MRAVSKYIFLIVIIMTLTSIEVYSQITEQENTRELLEKTKFNRKRGNLEGAIGYGLLGLDQAQAVDDQDLIVEFRKALGDIYLSKKDYQKAIANYLAIVGSSDHLVLGYYSLANTYSKMGAYVKAAEYYNHVAAQYERVGDKKGKARSIESLGLNYIASNQTEKAIETYETLLTLAISDKQYSYLSKAQEQLFVQNRILGNTSQAIKYGVAYYDRIKDRGDSPKIAETADLLSGQYLNANQNKNALKYANIAVQKDPNRNEYLENLGKALGANSNFSRSMQVFNDAIERNEKQRKSLAVARNYNQMAKVACDNEDYKGAIGYLEKAEKIGTQKNSRITLLDTYMIFAASYGKRGISAQQSEYQSLYEAVKMQIGDSDKIVSKVSAVKENQAENFEQKARTQLSKQENMRLAKEREKLRSEQKIKELELVEHKSKLQEVQLEQKALEAERAMQELRLVEQGHEALTRKAELDSLQTEAQLSKLKEEERIKQLELSEKQRQIAEQQREFEAKQAKQAKLIQYLIIGAAILILVILGIAFFRTYSNNKTISEQNQNLAEQQKTILNRNIQLKKSSEAMLAMNNKIKKAHVNLKILLKKEQETKEELEKANTEIKNTQVHLVQAEKMSSLGLLTAGIAHEINNPINFVSSGVQSLLQNFQELNTYIENYQKVLSLDKIEDIKKYANILKEDESSLLELQEGSDELLDDVNYGIKRITEIVDGLRSFSRHDEAEVKEADINESFNSALLILKNKYKNKAEVVLNIDNNLPLVQCFPGQINQVFVNLINNALDAMEEGGKITLHTKDLNDDFIEIRIEDNGSGMPNEVRDKIFDPFFTTKDIGKGTGLGLSISHGIIEKHKGTIKVESEVGVGTTFIIKLPKKLEVDDKILEEQLL